MSSCRWFMFVCKIHLISCLEVFLWIIDKFPERHIVQMVGLWPVDLVQLASCSVEPLFRSKLHLKLNFNNSPPQNIFFPPLQPDTDPQRAWRCNAEMNCNKFQRVILASRLMIFICPPLERESARGASDRRIYDSLLKFMKCNRQ